MSKSQDLFADLLSTNSIKKSEKNIPLSQRLNSTPSSNGVSSPNNTNMWPDLGLLEQLGSTGASGNSSSVGIADLPKNKPVVASSVDIDTLFEAFNQPSPAPQQSQQGPQPVSDDFLPGNSSNGSQDPVPPSRGSEPVSSAPLSSSGSTTSGVSKRDEALAELVDMGFGIDQANEALESTDSGRDVNQAITYLMNAAHSKAKQEKLGANGSSSHSSDPYGDDDGFGARSDDLGAMVNELSVELKNKASFWLQTGRKTLAKGIDLYKNQQLEKNNSQPAWMKNRDRYKAQSMRLPDDDPSEEVSPEEMRRIVEDQRLREIQIRKEREREQDLKLKQKRDEARAKLQTHRQNSSSPSSAHSSKFDDPLPSRRRQPPSSVSPPQEQFRANSVEPQSSSASTASTSSSASPSFSGSKTDSFMDIFSAPVLTSRPASRAKTENDEMYVSSSRRRAPAPKRANVPQVTRTKIVIPEVSVSPDQLSKFELKRTEANDLFKKGDFTNALVGYQSCLTLLPSSHKLTIVVNSNLATCFLKLGDAKSALSSADSALSFIGSFGGAPGDLAGVEVESGKPLKQFWIKLVSRKAEALENLEKYADALSAYNMLVENGGASKQVMDGKKRCQEVVQGKPPAKAQPKKAPTKPSVSKPSAAMKTVNEQSQKQQQFEAEKFQLHDQVEARVQEWKRGKEDNLRALLSSLQLILWQDANWKPVSVGELIMEKKVKITYMKAVAKVHPDKVSPTASTEQKLVAQAVFVSLNQAWAKFKEANGME
ncbi:unnamed protein product [Kuraishia capsulata CBS 1993]|uniref:UBA domain-containing protein n=1 Tax=Kuraishia capsulata CBS 1993 TaxID=1382522 RepID=W6MY27_9ASCO|nr:uncharacterized protein KUCA_T00005899001 [Kuraishia capsulata CBS 1993]CDK29905.1 unnamed protein product [Kuraishia capsulata CBS 1993]